jgi:hypothetical protein
MKRLLLWESNLVEAQGNARYNPFVHNFTISFYHKKHYVEPARSFLGCNKDDAIQRIQCNLVAPQPHKTGVPRTRRYNSPIEPSPVEFTSGSSGRSARNNLRRMRL